jgi:transposase
LRDRRIRGEADRSRAVLLTLEGWTSPEIAAAFGATSDSVRLWRSWFGTGGVEALRSTIAPGPSPEKGERALAVARDVLCAPVENRPDWTLPRLQTEIERRAVRDERHWCRVARRLQHLSSDSQSVTRMGFGALAIERSTAWWTALSRSSASAKVLWAR